MLDTNQYYAKLANHTTISGEEVLALLKEVEHFRGCTAYLASCQAATLEGLPKSTSRSARGRHVALCVTAAQMLIGDASQVKYPTSPEHARERCLRAAETHAGNP